MNTNTQEIIFVLIMKAYISHIVAYMRLWLNVCTAEFRNRLWHWSMSKELSWFAVITVYDE